ncbi:MAG: hypothetical protein GF364_04915 [Candidatus Lokiarchaeota archaeon]|nr:hypothetical protein [Candidatus Lokiarchaeota archaeon]
MKNDDIVGIANLFAIPDEKSKDEEELDGAEQKAINKEGIGEGGDMDENLNFLDEMGINSSDFSDELRSLKKLPVIDKKEIKKPKNPEDHKRYYYESEDIDVPKEEEMERDEEESPYSFDNPFFNLDTKREDLNYNDSQPKRRLKQENIKGVANDRYVKSQLANRLHDLPHINPGQMAQYNRHQKQPMYFSDEQDQNYENFYIHSNIQHNMQGNMQRNTQGNMQHNSQPNPPVRQPNFGYGYAQQIHQYDPRFRYDQQRFINPYIDPRSQMNRNQAYFQTREAKISQEKRISQLVEQRGYQLLENIKEIRDGAKNEVIQAMLDGEWHKQTELIRIAKRKRYLGMVSFGIMMLSIREAINNYFILRKFSHKDGEYVYKIHDKFVGVARAAYYNFEE